MSAARIVGLGEVLLRLSPPGNARLAFANRLDVHIGGAEANVLAQLTALGHTTALISALPDGPLGERARNALRERGLNISSILTGSGRLGLYFHEQGAGARPSAIVYDRDGSSFSRLKPDDVDWSEALDGARLLHVSGVTPALGPDGASLVQAAMTAARHAGCKIAFDGNFRSQLWAAWNGDPRATLAPLVAQADILFGNHRDVGLLTGQELAGDGEDRRRAAAELAFDTFPDLSLIASTARTVVDAGRHRLSARVDAREQSVQTREVDLHGIVDRIGTGDAFAAGVLHRWLADSADDTAMAETALALCALAHSVPGDMTNFSQADIDGFAKGASDIRR